MGRSQRPRHDGRGQLAGRRHATSAATRSTGPPPTIAISHMLLLRLAVDVSGSWEWSPGGDVHRTPGARRAPAALSRRFERQWGAEPPQCDRPGYRVTRHITPAPAVT